MQARKLFIISGLSTLISGAAIGQIPDLLNSLDAGGRAMGMGGATYGSGADTTSTLSNPAGLAYVTNRTAGVNIRNLPGSETSQTGSFLTGSKSSKGTVGHLSISHFGIVLPMTRNGKSAGAFGFSYTNTGYIRDVRTGVGNLVVDATTSYANYSELNRAKVDMFTLGYGRSLSDSLSVGASVILATTSARNIQSYTLVNNNNPIGNPTSDTSSEGTGVGAVVGMQYLPAKSNAVVGLSVRTPMNMRGNGVGAKYYDKIPGRISLSAASRRDSVRREGDYLLIGGTIETTFRNNGAQAYNRVRRVNFGGGLEYGLPAGETRIPIRLGFVANPSAGTLFDDRNALTFGFGYRPLNQPYTLDLNFASASGGKLDTALSLTFRF